MQISLPDDLGLSEREIKEELAIALYQRETVSLAKAAKIAGLTRLDFQRLLADRGLYIHFDSEDYDADIETLRKLGQL
jgi:predicted HTH domain antitoxin